MTDHQRAARGGGIRVGRRAFGAAWALVVMLAASSVAPTALAGPTYVLDRGRTAVGPLFTERGIVKVVGGTQSRISLSAGTPPPILPLKAPVGIDVEEVGDDLYITDSGGYSGSYDISGTVPCDGNLCGAVVRVNPGTGAAELVSSPSQSPNYLLDPYGITVISSTAALVADQGRVAVVSVDLTDGSQALFNEMAEGSTYPGGLRSPWSVARDPSGDILVVNNGNAVEPPDSTCVTPQANGFCPQELDIAIPASCQSSRGYVMRYDSSGQQEAMYCSTQFVKPRDAVVAADGTIFVTDPFANDGAASGFGTVFEIDPASGSVQPVTAGNNMATASGLDFNLAGDRLLLSDETLYPYPDGVCVGGCGGLVQVNPDGGEQLVTERREAPANWMDPIDVAVDRDQLGTPSLAVNTVPEFDKNPLRTELPPGPAGTYRMLPVRGSGTPTLICLDAGCAAGGGRQQTKTLAALAPEQFRYDASLRFEYRACTSKKFPVLKGERCYKKKKKRVKKRSAALARALFDLPAEAAKKSCKRCWRKSRAYSATKVRLYTSAPAVAVGRFVDVDLSAGVTQLGSGCAVGVDQVSQAVPVTVVCPPAQ